MRKPAHKINNLACLILVHIWILTSAMRFMYCAVILLAWLMGGTGALLETCAQRKWSWIKNPKITFNNNFLSFHNRLQKKCFRWWNRIERCIILIIYYLNNYVSCYVLWQFVYFLCLALSLFQTLKQFAVS